MKVIDDVTRTYLVDLTAVVKWGSSSIDVLVKTWPFVSMKSIKNESTANKKCAACHKTSCRKTAIFYGQPYQRDTLQGCNSNSIPNNLDKVLLRHFRPYLSYKIYTKKLMVNFVADN